MPTIQPAAAAPASTPRADFADAVLQGLAPDGGLYVPESFPAFTAAELAAMRHLSYPELAVRIMRRFTAGSLADGELAGMVQDSYACFEAQEVTPLVPLGQNLSLLELFHGPTLAFKDIALQFLGRLFGHYADREARGLTVVGATSGDTGSAAIAGCQGIGNVRMFILYPQDGPSEVQRRQMTCVEAPNVHALAVKGSFDDCQALVKRLLSDRDARARHRLTAVNSINWARILAQIVYYFYAGLKAGALDIPVNFVVPTGNFGNIYAGYAAKRLGLPVAMLVAATNRNDSLVRFINDGTMMAGAVQATLSPSMDIQIASNAERFLYELLNRDGHAVQNAMAALKNGKTYQLPSQAREMLARDFMALGVDDDATLATMKALWDEKRMLVDPHTAVGLHAARRLANQLAGPVIAMACAHPAKFPATVKRATGQDAPLPARLADLYGRPERIRVIANDYAALISALDEQERIV